MDAVTNKSYCHTGISEHDPLHIGVEHNHYLCGKSKRARGERRLCGVRGGDSGGGGGGGGDGGDDIRWAKPAVHSRAQVDRVAVATDQNQIARAERKIDVQGTNASRPGSPTCYVRQRIAHRRLGKKDGVAGSSQCMCGWSTARDLYSLRQPSTRPPVHPVPCPCRFSNN